MPNAQQNNHEAAYNLNTQNSAPQKNQMNYQTGTATGPAYFNDLYYSQTPTTNHQAPKPVQEIKAIPQQVKEKDPFDINNPFADDFDEIEENTKPVNPSPELQQAKIGPSEGQTPLAGNMNYPGGPSYF